jgi:photosystem II stability/assembly factor-like uncharacterized protein
LVIDPSTTATLYAGIAHEGVFKSVDGGKSWVAVNAGLTDPSVWALAIDPLSPATLYAGTETFGITSGGVFKTVNGGESWSPANSGMTETQVRALVIDPTHPTTLYAGTWGDGVFKSTNGGNSWVTVNANLANVYVWALAVDPLTPTILYAGTNGGLFKSTNGGANWEFVDIGNGDTRVQSLAVDPAVPNFVYVGTFRGVFMSTNKGVNWIPLESGLTAVSTQALVVDPLTPATIHAGMDGGGVVSYSNSAIPPTVTSIARANANPTGADSVSFTITFGESVTGVGTSAPYNDFVLTTSGVTGANIASVSGSGASYTVKVNTGTGNGTIRLDVKDDNSIVGASGLPLGGPSLGDGDFQAGEIYVIARNSSFADVPAGYWSGSYIERLFAAGITGGCNTSPLRYCPREPVTRAQLAVFLLRGRHTAAYLPPAPIGVFQDVPSGYWAKAWIDQLSAEAITYGCSLQPKKFCPEQPVTRAQMAILLLRARHGVGYVPPKATGIFEDVPTSYWAADWIEQLAVEGTTAGCSLTPKRYCPNQPVTRDQMAIFVVRNFQLP